MKNKFWIFVLIILVFIIFIALILTPINKKPVAGKAHIYKGRIVIVIDDWGYRLSNLSIITEIKEPLTCAVLPNLKNSILVAQKLHNLGFEIILHLPMESKERYGLENNTIRLGQGAEEIRNILNKDLTSVVFAKGVSNHMGSAITENVRSSSIVMAEVKKRKLYFFDSFVTPKSICQEVAKRIKIKFAKKDLFLDNEDDPEYIKEKLIKLSNLSTKHGFAIGIGHDRKTTLMVLKEMLPQLKKQGYKFVFLSEVVK